jgi:hypothetical protein
MATYNITVTPSTTSGGWTYSGDSTDGSVGRTTSPISEASTINFTLAADAVTAGWSWLTGSSSTSGKGNTAFFVTPNANSNFTWADPGSSAKLVVSDADNDPGQSGSTSQSHSYTLYANLTTGTPPTTTKYDSDPQIINKRG